MAATVNSSMDAPQDNRIEAGSVNIAAGSFPETAFPAKFEAEQVAIDFVESFQQCLKSRDLQGLAGMFLEEGYWRDHLCLSWDFRTLKGPDKIAAFLATQGHRLEGIKLNTSAPHRAPQVANADVYGKSKCVCFFIDVTTDVGSGQGVVRLAHEGGAWKALAFYTALQELKGFEEPLGPRRALGVEHGTRDAKNWQEKREASKNFDGSEPQVLIIGAGQGGLNAAARLKMLNVSALVIDRNDRVGDNWRQRYRQLVLHDPIWFDHMPYMEFPNHWPVFTPKDKLAEFFEAYVILLELNVWMKTELVSSSWDDAKGQWTVVVERGVGDTKETRTLHPHHIVQATGHSGKKNFPTMKGMDSFRGRLCHSSEFPGAQPNSAGKRAVVVGSCNSGHDIAQDYAENGYDVTMVQRTSTCVVSSSSITDIALASLYAEGSPPVDDADLLNHSVPAALQKALHVQVTEVQGRHDRATLEGLQGAGFKVDKGVDGAGLMFKYYQRGGGYYIDVGASQLIIDGRIKIKQGQEIEEVLPDGLRFADGSELRADEIVFATGYQNMRTQARALFGDGVADKVRDVWGLDEEGEFRTMWRRSGHPGFWFMGGNLALARFFGRFLALQIKAIEEGLASYDTV